MSTQQLPELMPFDPDGVSADQFWFTYFEGVETEADPETLDPITGPESVPVNPLPDRVVNSFAVRTSAHARLPEGMLQPNLAVTGPTKSGGFATVRLWFTYAIDVQDEKARKAANLFAMVRHATTVALGGVRVEEIPNPATTSVALKWQAERYTLGAHRTALKTAGLWRDTLPPEFLSRGGSSTSEAKAAAARSNLSKVNDDRRASALQRASEVVSAADEGHSAEVLAQRFGIAVDSVAVIVSRARKRLKN